MKFILVLFLILECLIAFLAIEHVSLGLMNKPTAGGIMIVLALAAVVICKDWLREA